MRRAMGLVGLAAVAESLECHSIVPGVSDSWCNTNCNFIPKNCPESICKCGGPSPTPPSPPVPPSPTPAPVPPSPTPAPGPAPPLPAEIRGYYSWNWGAGSTGPTGANMGCSFTGLGDVENAIKQYPSGAGWCCPDLVGIKTLTLGGGNSAGTFNEARLKTINTKMDVIKNAGYSAVMYDVEEVVGPSSIMARLFSESFAAAHKAGLITAVTTSHSAPYQCDSAQDSVNLVKAWCADENLDIISPQLYSSGYESEPELVPTNSCKDAGCTWDLYAACKAEIAPSIVRSSQYDLVKSFFAKNISRDTRGYFVWAQKKGEAIAV